MHGKFTDHGAYVLELSIEFDKLTCFERLAMLPHCLFLESVTNADDQGRYSFLTADPFEFVSLWAADPHITSQLRELLGRFQSPTIPELPPFQGGAAGLLSYDLNRSLESLEAPHRDQLPVPAVAIGLFDVVLAFDHRTKRQWLISQGFPEHDTNLRKARAEARAQQFIQHLQPPATDRQAPGTILETVTQYTATPLRAPIAEDLVPVDHPLVPPGLLSNFSRDEYLRSVQRVIDYIRQGDAFQVNLAQQLFFPADVDSRTLYRRLRERNPAPFAGYFAIDADCQIVSASPERFLQIRDGRVEARPIKGTRRRQHLPEANLYAGQELKDSEKDQAENTMIVDLLRNDLARVCTPESVRVTQLCDVEEFEFVLHLVSAVEGVLRADRTPYDLLEAAFPGGSITGAPKVRAMEIIQELEPDARGAYCGSLGYVGFDGTSDFSILIRTITAINGWWQIPVGGGVIVQSDPAAEYEETWHKAVGMLKAIVP
jgi:para-aminobenzoate synthetase component 1